MSKKHFIALADAIRAYNKYPSVRTPFDAEQIEWLASFCSEQNYRFNKSRWLAYIAGECGPSGGSIKSQKKEEALASV